MSSLKTQRLSKFIKDCNASTEAIDFQHGSALFNELELAFSNLRRIGKFKEADLISVGLPNIIRKRTNINISFNVLPTNTLAIYIKSPQVSSDGLFTVSPRASNASVDGAINSLSKNNTVVNGTVDLRTSKVGGIFSKVNAPIFMSSGLLSSTKLTNAELAALVLHEVGHMFTYFEFLTSMARFNYAIWDITNGFNNTSDKKQLVKMIKVAESSLGVNIEDADSLANSPNIEVVQTVFFKAYMDLVAANPNTNCHDSRAWEYLSDQFATRHGAGAHLVTGIDKMYRARFHSSTINTSVYLALDVLRTLGLVSAFTTFGLVAKTISITMVGVSLSNSNEQQYDPPEERFVRIRNQLVEALKDKEMGNWRRVEMLQSIATIDNSLSAIKDKTSIVTYLWRIVSPTARKKSNQRVIEKDLESLSSNSLFEASAKIQTVNV